MSRAFIYRNLTKGCYSVQCTKTGRLLYHADEVFVIDAELVVRPGGRRRVLDTGHKNVHAGIRGMLKPGTHSVACRPTEITYNPYLYDSFVVKTTGKRICSARSVHLGPFGVYACGLVGRDSRARLTANPSDSRQ